MADRFGYSSAIFSGVALLSLVGCGPGSSATSTSVSSPLAGTSTPPTVASATAAPSGATIVATGAAPSATATVAFVVFRTTGVGGDSVEVVFTAKSKNGQKPVQTTVLATIAAGGTDAVTGDMAIPSGDQIDGVSAAITVVAQTPTAPGAIAASGGQYTEDPIQPTAALTLLSPVATNVDAVAVCWSAGGAILGGGSEAGVALQANASRQLKVPLDLQDVPDHCSVYARAS